MYNSHAAPCRIPAFQVAISISLWVVVEKCHLLGFKAKIKTWAISGQKTFADVWITQKFHSGIFC